METQSSRTPSSAPRPVDAAPSPAADWQPSEAGIIDRMSAYRDWWNIPARRKPRASRPQRTERA